MLETNDNTIFSLNDVEHCRDLWNSYVAEYRFPSFQIFDDQVLKYMTILEQIKYLPPSFRKILDIGSGNLELSRMISIIRKSKVVTFDLVRKKRIYSPFVYGLRTVTNFYLKSSINYSKIDYKKFYQSSALFDVIIDCCSSIHFKVETNFTSENIGLSDTFAFVSRNLSERGLFIMTCDVSSKNTAEFPSIQKIRELGSKFRLNSKVISFSDNDHEPFKRIISGLPIFVCAVIFTKAQTAD